MRSFVAIALLIAHGLATAHESPNELIHRLTHELGTQPTNVKLLLMRGTEYRAVGDLDHAEADYRQAIELNPRDASAYILLAQMLVHEERYADALAVIPEAHAVATHREHLDELHRLGAEVMAASGAWGAAQESIDAMTAESRGELSVVLLQSRVFQETGRLSERIVYLDGAIADNGAVVLEIERINALTADGRFDIALAYTNEHLNARRHKAVWLVRRASIYEAMGYADKQRSDIRRAVDELERRVDRVKPDPFLVGLLKDARAELERVSGS